MAGRQSVSGLKRRGIGRGNGGLFRFLTCGMAVVIVAAGACVTRPAVAAPDKPVISGSTATFSGDQHLGISSLSDFSTQSIDTLNVTGLTQDIAAPLPAGAGIFMSYTAGNGKDDSDHNNGGTGGAGKKLTLTYDGGAYLLKNSGDGQYEALFLSSIGGNGGNGGKSTGSVTDETGGYGGAGGNGGDLTLTLKSGAVQGQGDASGIVVLSTGGNGGIGGEAKTGLSKATGGAGGAGGNGGAITIDSSSSITAATGSAVMAVSAGGNGNYAGLGDATKGVGGKGGSGGAGGAVTVTSRGSLSTPGNGEQQHGIYAISQGGDALNQQNSSDKYQSSGGYGGGAGGFGGDGGSGGNGGAATVANYGAISGQGNSSIGIYAVSKGGKGGDGGRGDGLDGEGGGGGGGGAGGDVSVTNQGGIATSGSDSNGIMAASLGGAGGNGGEANGISGKGGAAKQSGKGGAVTVGNSGALQTAGDYSRGIFAQSVGGFAGSGGSVGFAFGGYGADGTSGGIGGNVTVTNTGSVTTAGTGSGALYGQSIGGGGGSGGSAGGLFVNGGNGDAGGNGGTVTIENHGILQTSRTDSAGVFAQSIGGGGGNGGGAINAAPKVSVAIGGQGGSGGAGSTVTVTSSNQITTAGNNSTGIHAQSAGGGGGNGGYAISASAGIMPSFTFSAALGGAGGSGGAGGLVSVSSSSAITTGGDNAYGILAESLGGGGGVGGFSVAASVSAGYSATMSLGGSGGDGGNAGQKVAVATDSSGSVTTSGVSAHGILAQSVGGGGGAGGYSASGSLGVTGSATFSLGGKGGKGGAGYEVDVTNNSAIATSGKMAYGILAQSVGGGGGTGGYSIGASLGLISGSITVGGSGGSGGAGGVVNVTNNAAVSTTGEQGFGILAQSIGGGGGAGGYSLSADVAVAALGFTLGGKGTAGGQGGVVTLINSGAITTGATGAHGILAQSVGGGGGAGGWAGTGAMSFGVQAGEVTIPSLSLAVALGGQGGPGSSSQKVSVQNTGAILTKEEGSDGILAQSIGGGGGDGGWATAVALNFSAGKTYSANVSVAHGGTGGSGGAGGEVDVTNGGSIQTMLENSPGILAQSIGGGGGNGGLSAAVTMSASTPSASTFNSAVSLGGKAGDGGSAALVKVTSTAPVTTAGDGSTGIEAQSIGGGGGDGGASVTGVLGLTTKNNYQLGLSVGGAGGGGGISGEVDVTTSGNVTTGGNQAVGVLAQSIGGGGGDGGMSFNGDLVINETKSLSVAVGGKGGKGGNGGVVNVTTNGGAISTSGTDSHGIFAQSVGGGGGTGNLAGSGTVDFYGTEKYGVNLAVNVGGSGGVAGSGSTVAVTNKASVSTSGEKAFGIYAQSVGGGGGEAGGGFTGHLNTELPESGFNWELGVSVGGNGGNGNNGGSVTVDNQGGLSTLGDKSHGIFAQSVGGGGGAGGDARDFSLVISEPSVKPEHVTSLYVGVGGKGGGSSSGGAVTVTNTAAIATQGDYAKGIFAQSVGGGGGEGGGNKGHSLRDTLIPGTVSISVGGAGGSSGAGGAVSVTNSGAITTAGEGAYGIQAQSVGGGGGVGGEGELGLLKLSIGIGGEAGGAGNGNTSTVFNSGAITTSGDGAHGIFAQSVGGGGGTAGNVARFLSEYADIGIGIGWAPSKGGAGGNGGAVTVTNTSDITTHGASAYGIQAQSVGGGGGEGGEVGYGPGAIFNYFMGSVGGAGSGGLVTVNHSGRITTTGDDSVGIFAQSAGGEGTGGAVNITVGGDVLSSGADSNAIQAQSLGLEGNGNIAVTINSGTVQGGTGGTGVVFMDGNANTLTNHGVITTLDGANGVAVTQQAGSDAPYHGSLTVNNYGTITGSVNQGAQALSKYKIQDTSLPTGDGTITFNNNAGAVFAAGSIVNLGSGALTNSGTLNPGAGETRQTHLTGNYIQKESGVFDVTLNGDGSSDRLDVSGTATLAGALRGLSGSGAFRNGTSYTVLTAGEGITAKFTSFDLHDTPLVSFFTSHVSDSVRVVSSVKSFTTVADGILHRLLARHMDSVTPVASGDFSQALREIQTMAGSKYENAFESLSPGIYDAGTITTFDVTRQYIRALQQRMQAARESRKALEMKALADFSRPVLLAHNGPAEQSLQVARESRSASPQRKLGMWIQGVGQWGDRSSVDGFSGYDYSMGGAALGVDYGVSDRVALGASFGYAYTSIDQDNRFANGSVTSYFGSLYGAYFSDRFYLDGVLTYGNHSYDNNRAVSIGSISDLMSSDHDGNGFSVFVEGGYALPAQKWVVQPLVSLLYSSLDESGFRESGAHDLHMSMGSRQTNYVVSEVGLRVSRPITTSMGILTPEVKATWQHDFDVDDRIMPVTFAGAPVTLNIDGRKIGHDSAAIEAGFSFTGTGGITTSLKYNGILQAGYTAHSVMGQLQLSF